MRLLEKSPNDRPNSAQAVVDTIRVIERQIAARRQLADLGMGSTPPPLAPGARPPIPDPGGRRTPLIIASGLIAVLALGSLVRSRSRALVRRPGRHHRP